jgi:hypothetical protein
LLVSGLLCSLFDATSARADDARELERRTFMARFAFGASLIGGSKLVGVGSRARYTQGAMQIEMNVARVVSKPLGIEIGLQFLPPTRDERELAYGRLEGAFDFVLADWGGRRPGSLIAGIGGGFDVGRWWFSDPARGFGVGLLRGRLWLTRNVNVQLSASVVPFAAKLNGWEQRYELAVAYGLLSFGVRFAYVSVKGGDPARWLGQHEVGAFVGVGVF